MEKLKKKIFWVIFFILTIFLLSILCIFNYQSYNQEKKVVKDNLTRMEDNRSEQFKPDELDKKELDKNTEDNSNKMENQLQEPPVFMDAIAYTAIYNDENEVIDILNHTQNNFSYDEIKEVAEKILKENQTKTMKIGNLYWERYSYSYKEHNSLIIIDNTTIQSKLISLLKTSITIFILLEIMIIIVSVEITSWIIRPVLESFERQKQFIADASHELKTPITVIMANAEALENEPDEKKWLENIRSEAKRMNDLVTDLLDLAKLENGINKENYHMENLSKVIEKTLLTFESLMYENNIKLEYDIMENINIICNINQMKQLVAILLDNAIQHSEKNGEIKLLLTKEKNDVVLKVSNKGKEIPKEIQEKIFERFYRADESRNRDGNRYGLGLAIAKNIVTNHNGKIAVQSDNKYTTFIVRIKQV